VGVRWSENELTSPHDTSGVCHPAWQDLVHTFSLSRTALGHQGDWRWGSEIVERFTVIREAH
jgi:hypothetical protein